MTSGTNVSAHELPTLPAELTNRLATFMLYARLPSATFTAARRRCAR